MLQLKTFHRAEALLSSKRDSTKTAFDANREKAMFSEKGRGEGEQ